MIYWMCFLIGNYFLRGNKKKQNTNTHIPINIFFLRKYVRQPTSQHILVALKHRQTSPERMREITHTNTHFSCTKFHNFICGRYKLPAVYFCLSCNLLLVFLAWPQAVSPQLTTKLKRMQTKQKTFSEMPMQKIVQHFYAFYLKGQNDKFSNIQVSYY